MSVHAANICWTLCSLWSPEGHCSESHTAAAFIEFTFYWGRQLFSYSSDKHYGVLWENIIGWPEMRGSGNSTLHFRLTAKGSSVL